MDVAAGGGVAGVEVAVGIYPDHADWFLLGGGGDGADADAVVATEKEGEIAGLDALAGDFVDLLTNGRYRLQPPPRPHRHMLLRIRHRHIPLIKYRMTQPFQHCL